MHAEKALACRLDALTPAERSRHAALTKELRSAARSVVGLPRGYAFLFPDDSASARRVVEWVALEYRCCPFLEFELVLGETGEPIVLNLTGREGVKEFLAEELAPLFPEERANDPSGPAPVEIGALEPGEEDALRSLLARCGLPEAGVLDHRSTALVAREGGRLVGSAVLEIYSGGALLRSVAVESDRRGLGLGVRLTEEALALARRRGLPRVYLLTETAAEFFPRFGFRKVSREKVPASVRASLEFTTACPQSALVMEREL
ncbi:MAG: arsenic resistance N-acetyltransferase ArsN2 [Acidobacteriota bacterium]